MTILNAFMPYLTLLVLAVGGRSHV